MWCQTHGNGFNGFGGIRTLGMQISVKSLKVQTEEIRFLSENNYHS